MEIQRINIKNMEIKMEKEKTCKIVFSDIDAADVGRTDHGGDEGDDPES